MQIDDLINQPILALYITFQPTPSLSSQPNEIGTHYQTSKTIDCSGTCFGASILCSDIFSCHLGS